MPVLEQSVTLLAGTMVFTVLINKRTATFPIMTQIQILILILKLQYYDLENPTDSLNFKTGLSKQSEYYRRNRDLLIISMVGFYGLNIIDASVDAHLFDFDISEDLTLNWQPAVRTFENQLVYGINCTFKF
jgi:hypothetical protein